MLIPEMPLQVPGSIYSPLNQPDIPCVGQVVTAKNTAVFDQVKPAFGVSNEAIGSVLSVYRDMPTLVPLQRRIHFNAAKRILNPTPLFRSEGPQYQDVRQGEAGDCALLALLAALARHRPAVLLQAIEQVDRSGNQYRIHYFAPQSGEQMSMVVFDTSYVDQYNQPIYAGDRRGIQSKDKVSWVKVLENWFAKMSEQYDLLVDLPGIDSIAYGGWSKIPFQLLMGYEMTMVKPVSLDNFNYTIASVEHGKIVTLVTKANTFSEYILPGMHSYAVLESNPAYVTLYDPTGRTIEINVQQLYESTHSLWIGD